MSDENTDLLREIRDILAQIQAKNLEDVAKRDEMFKRNGRNLLVTLAILVVFVACVVFLATRP
jgi:hypothetical protein